MKSRLRHPIRAIREPFGKAGLILACIALIAAVGGTAYAATKLNGTQKKEVEKIAKKFAGKPGAPGAAGTNGTNGTNGKDGTNGAPGANGNTVLNGSAAPQNTEGQNGDFFIKTGLTPEIFGPKAAGAWPATGTKLKGSNGSPGTAGENGKTVLNGTVDPTTQGTEGDFYINTTSDKIFGPKTGAGWGTGTSLKGEKGEPGETGFTAHLPSGKTETGMWSIYATTSSVFREVTTPISFSIPLEHGAHSAVFVNAEKTSELDEGEIAEFEGCTGTLEVPTAPAGKLCVYTGLGENIEEAGTHQLRVDGFNAEFGREPGSYSPSGAFVEMTLPAGPPASAVIANGSWAVTAP